MVAAYGVSVRGHKRAPIVWEAGHTKAEQGRALAHMPGKTAYLFPVRGDSVPRLVLYWDHERALADLGPASEAGSPDA
jgi:hypothetical protein